MSRKAILLHHCTDYGCTYPKSRPPLLLFIQYNNVTVRTSTDTVMVPGTNSLSIGYLFDLCEVQLRTWYVIHLRGV